MKKSVLGLLVAFAAFSFGVLAAEIFAEKQNLTEFGENDNVETFVIINQDVPLFEVGQLDQSKEIQQLEEIEEDFVDPKTIHAWYSLDDYKKMPEVGMINFYGTDVDDDGNKLNEMAYDTGVYTKLFKDDVREGFAQSIETKVEGNKLKFKTKKLKGIEYLFQGTFFKNKMTGEQEEKVLRGTLQKFVKGKKVAEVSGDFAYGEPYCLH